MRRFALSLLLVFSALPMAFADGAAQQVHVYQQTLAGGVAAQLSDQTLETGAEYQTTSAPAKSGYIFTHWSISTTQYIDNRDRLGRAREVASYTLYEETTLTANYLPNSQDDDGDGVPDGWEIYWYGNLSKDAASDTDGDGFTFTEELAAGLDPLMPDASLSGGVAWADGALLQYNPDNLHAYIVRSEPEGSLFSTQIDYQKPGQVIPIPSVGGTFAYWAVDGVRQADRLGRALDTISVTMPEHAIEIVAVSESDETRRKTLYWYGDASVGMDSDTDGDGFTFAEELAAGTNPLMPDESLAGGVVWADGALLQYNPDNIHPYVIRSEPEGSLFATQSDYLTAGLMIPIPSVGGNFAYWMIDGVRQADRLGRALDTLPVAMPESAIEIVAVSESEATRRDALYWYGDASVGMDSDTDGDGFTFAEELAAGTNPLMPDESLAGGVVWADGALLEMNLQVYEQITGALVGDAYEELFTSPISGNAGSSRTFDGEATPTVVDLNGDGLFDLVVVTGKGTYTVFLNMGTSGNPMFEEKAWSEVWRDAFNEASTNTLEGLTFDVAPVNATSWTFADVDGDGVRDLLVADEDGRIWFYKGNKSQGTGNGAATSFKLQHKVWGGSFPGFATGLKISAVDWDDDGDIDLVCGTAEGKLMLLNDPRAGRPVNVQAEAGATSVVLTWNPNVNSRVRGYGIYRSADSSNYEKVENLCPLPRYRDEPPAIQDWYYRVTGKSRFYVTGNSTPMESESIPTDAVYVQMKPRIWLNDTSSFTGEDVEVVVSINNSMGLSPDGFSMTFTYDPTVLEPVEIKRTGLTRNLEFGENASDGIWRLNATGGEIAVGAGEFLRLVFHVKPVHDVTETTVTLTATTIRSAAGQAVSVDLPKSAKIEISDANPLQPAIVSVQVSNASVETGDEFGLPFTITSSEALASGGFKVTYDGTMLEWKGAEATEGIEGTLRAVTVAATESGTLSFKALEQHSVVTNFATVVAISDFNAVDCNGFEVTADDSQGTVLIKNAHPILPAVVSLSTEDKKVDTLETVVIPFNVVSSESLSSGQFTVEYDTSALTYEGSSGTIDVSATGDFALKFLANDQHDITMTQVRLTTATVTDVNGFVVSPTTPVVSTILIHDAHPLIPAVVSMSLGDVAAATETEFDMTISIASTEELTALKMAIDYDTSLLELRSGVLEYTGSVPSSATFRFYAKENHTVNQTAVTITPISATDHNNFTTEITLPELVTGNVILADSNPWQPATVAVGIGVSSDRIDTRSEFALPVTITSNETLTNFVATVTWDSDALEYRGENPLVFTGEVPTTFNLPFYAKDQHDKASAVVGLSAMSAVDNHGLVANPIADATATVLIHDAFPLIPAEVAVMAATVAADTMTTFAVPVAITSSKVLTDFTARVGWDDAVLEYRGITGATFSDGLVTATGTVPDSFTLVFYAKDQHSVTETAVMLSNASAVCTDGLDANITLSNGKVMLVDSNPPVAVNLAVATLDARAESGKAFVIPLGATTDGDLASLSATVEWDADLLTFDGAEDASVSGRTVSSASLTFPASGTHNLFDLGFTAKAITALRTNATVRVTAAGGVGVNGLAAKLTTALPVESTVLIVRNIGKYDPGDINGDGKYTDDDMTMLSNYIKYQSIVSAAPQLASRYASWKLTGKALKAADANSDGKVDVNDVSMLAQLIASWKEANE